MMVKLMVPVVRDLVAENTGIESLVGQMVEVVKKIPKYKKITVATPGIGKSKVFPTRRDVYLVNAPRTRWMKGPHRVEEAIVLYCGYQGNDIYSAEELGL